MFFKLNFALKNINLSNLCAMYIWKQNNFSTNTIKLKLYLCVLRTMNNFVFDYFFNDNHEIITKIIYLIINTIIEKRYKF